MVQVLSSLPQNRTRSIFCFFWWFLVSKVRKESATMSVSTAFSYEHSVLKGVLRSVILVPAAGLFPLFFYIAITHQFPELMVSKYNLSSNNLLLIISNETALRNVLLLLKQISGRFIHEVMPKNTSILFVTHHIIEEILEG